MIFGRRQPEQILAEKLVEQYRQAQTALGDGAVVAEVHDGAAAVNALFLRTYGHPAPQDGKHQLILCKTTAGDYRLVNYLHSWERDRACFIGGAITDTRAMRHGVDADARRALRRAGGPFHLSMLHLLRHESDGTDAFFAHTAVPTVIRVLQALDFQPADTPHLWVRWSPGVRPRRRRRLLDLARSIGPF